MKSCSWFLAVLVLALATQVVLAQQAVQKQAAGTMGKITKIDGTVVNYQVAENGRVQSISFETDAATVVRVGSPTGDKMAVSDLAVGQQIAVELPERGKAAKLIVIIPADVKK